MRSLILNAVATVTWVMAVFTALALILIAAPSAHAQTVTYHRVAPGAYQVAATAQSVQVQASIDAHGFGPMLNGHRARYGLRQLVHDPSLDTWCVANNAACQARYGGALAPKAANGFPALHLVYEPSGWSCAGWGYRSAAHVLQGWLGSGPHAAALLRPDVTRYGIAYGPGPYWTLELLR